LFQILYSRIIFFAQLFPQPPNPDHEASTHTNTLKQIKRSLQKPIKFFSFVVATNGGGGGDCGRRSYGMGVDCEILK
jgi:hypothetical protein